MYDLLMIRICVFSVRKSRCGHRWHERTSICWCLGITFSGLGTSHRILLSCIVVDYLMYRICVSNCQMLWHVLCHPARGSIWWCSGIVFSGCETFKMSRSIQQECLLADLQVLRFETGKRWYMGSAKLQQGRFADIKETRLQFAKIFEYVYCCPARGSISYFTEITFSGLRNVMKCAVPNYKYDFLMMRISFFSDRKVIYGHW